MSAGLLYLGRRDVLSVLARLDPPLNLDGMPPTPEAYLGWSTPNGGAARSLSMPGGLDGGDGGLGVKIINSSLSNQTSGLPRASGLTLLFDRETARIDAIIGKTQAHIGLLRERRAALISAAVTGKMDVRNS